MRGIYQRRQLDTRSGSRLDHARQRQLEIRCVRHARIVATRAGDPKHRCTSPRGLGSASEAHCPARLGPGGAFFVAVAQPLRFIGSAA